jgi:hypothetical protein
VDKIKAAHARRYVEPRKSEDRERLESVKLRWNHALGGLDIV